jgi:hypothetical protein
MLPFSGNGGLFDIAIVVFVVVVLGPFVFRAIGRWSETCCSLRNTFGRRIDAALRGAGHGNQETTDGGALAVAGL